MERIPPHNEEAEKSVLGAILIKQDLLYDVAEIITGNDFYYKKHKEIYDAAMELQRRGEPIDSLTVCDELSKRGALDMAGGRGYVVSLGNEVPFTGNVEAYAKIVFSNAELRRIITTATEILGQGYEADAKAESVLEFAEREIFNISQKKGSKNTEELNEVLHRNLVSIDEKARNKGALTGVPSGLIDLDKVTTGFQNSDMVVLAARPSMGKTAFVLNVAQRAAAKGYKIMIFSLEMSNEQLGMRLLAMESRIDSQKLKIGDLDAAEWERLYLAIDELSKGEIVTDDTPGLSLVSVKNKCRKMKAEKGLDMVIIDYLQLLESDGKSENRLQEITSFSRGIKQLAREMNCPVIVLSQLSRSPETRPNHRPILSDLRESGAIEQDADQVLFLYRDEVYNPETEDVGTCEINVAKNRNGPIGTVKVRWEANHTRFENLLYGDLPFENISQGNGDY